MPPSLLDTATTMSAGLDDTPVVKEGLLQSPKPHNPNLLEPHHILSPQAQLMRYAPQKLKIESDVDDAEKARMDKEGLVVLRVNLSTLFSKDGGGKATMQGPLDYLKVFEVHVSTSAPLPKHVTKELKPMTLTVQKVSHLPTTPHSHSELKERYVLDHSQILQWTHLSKDLWAGIVCSV